MNTFNVYPLLDIEPVRGIGVYVWDNYDNKYLDLYGGHAVISVGHSHPRYIKAIFNQVSKLGFYSNYVKNSLQSYFAEKLCKQSGYSDYNLFLCNSGAEANENALKVASFSNGKRKVISFSNGFHGRTSLAAAVTDSKSITAPINETNNAMILPFNNIEALTSAFNEEISAVIIEGIQGVAGIYLPEENFLKKIEELCKKYNAVFIIDEIQSGYGRTGKFFAHQHYNIKPDIITVAKGIGNGFPFAGILLHPSFVAKYGMLGTTFGGNHLACAVGVEVLDILNDENLIQNANIVGEYLIQNISKISGVTEVRGKGLMIGVEFNFSAEKIRKNLLNDFRIITGASSNKNTLRLLPPLCISIKEADEVIAALKKCLEKIDVSC